MIRMIRGIFTSVTDTLGKVRRFSASGRSDETVEDREMFQHYGFASSPKSGAENVIFREGNLIISIADGDRRYRVALASGEVAIFTDEGDKIHLKRGRKIDILAGAALQPGEITIKAEGPLTGKILVQAGGQVDVAAPTVRLGGLALETALGIVTGACSCSITGAPHAVTSLTAKATL
jgi:phage gp45-like